MELISTEAFELYKRELELINFQNPVECELYSVIACLFRSLDRGRALSLRDVSSRRRTELSKRFYGDSGFPDFVILERQLRDTAACLGAIEAKNINIDLDRSDTIDQLSGHISFFKKVIFTNGLEWRYYKKDSSAPERREWAVVLGTPSNGSTISWKPQTQWETLLEKLAGIQWLEE